MTRQDFPGCWHCDALPSGEYAVLKRDNSGLHTHLGDIAVEFGNAPLFVRCTTNAYSLGFALAGQGSNAPNTPVWFQADRPPKSHWEYSMQVACGTSPVLWDSGGGLIISDCSVGSQGYRYWGTLGPTDPQPARAITGDETYASAFGLSEWTYLGFSTWIGQGSQSGGAVVFDGAVLRRLDSGYLRFIRATSNSTGVVGVAYYNEKTVVATVIQTTIAELRALPPVDQPIPPEPPIPPIPPIPPVVLSTPILDRLYERTVMSNQVAQVFSPSQLNDLGGGNFTVTISNPINVLYIGLPPVGTQLPGPSGNDVVLSVQPGGFLETRVKGTNGAYEQAKKVNATTLQWKPANGTCVQLPCGV